MMAAGHSLTLLSAVLGGQTGEGSVTFFPRREFPAPNYPDQYARSPLSRAEYGKFSVEENIRSNFGGENFGARDLRFPGILGSPSLNGRARELQFCLGNWTYPDDTSGEPFP